jgi:hypothetical protein
MALTKPNDPAAPVNPASFAAQSMPDQFDTDLISLGFQASGVISGCAVTQRAAGANMSVDVAAGTVEVAGTQVAVTGVNVAVGAAHATLPRFDLVVVTNAGVVSVVAGTASANPCDPAIPASRAVLAEIYVPAAVTSIITSYLVDKRVIVGLVSITNVMPTAATLLLYSRVTGDTQDRVQVQADGKHLFGSGSAVADTDWFRSGVGALKTTGALNVGTPTDTQAGRIAGSEAVFANRGAATETAIGYVGPSGASGITFQASEAGSNLYRESAGVLRMDGRLRAGTGVDLLGSPNGYTAGELRFQGNLTLASSIGVDTIGMLFDHRATSNTGSWYWRNGTGASTSRMDLSGTTGNLRVTGDDNVFGAGAMGGTGTYVWIGSRGDPSSAYVTVAGSGTNVNLIFRTKGIGAYNWQTEAGTLLASLDPNSSLVITQNGNIIIRSTSSSSNGVLFVRVSGDTQDRFTLFANGAQYWGSGAASADIILDRASAGVARFFLTPGNTVGQLQVKLSTPGTTAVSSVVALSDTSVDCYIITTSSTYTTNGLFVANQAMLYTDNSASLLICQSATADIIFATGGIATTNERMRISSIGNVTITTRPVNTAGGLVVSNPAGGNNASAYVQVANEAGKVLQIQSISATYVTNGLLVANLATLYGTGSALLVGIADASDVVFTTGGAATTNERLRLVNSDGSMLVTQQTVGNVVQKLTSVATNDDPTEEIRQYRVATTDATVTALATIAANASQSCYVVAHVVARRTGGAAGTAEDAAAYYIRGLFKNNAGLALQVGATAFTIIGESNAAYDCDFAASSGNILLRVTGVASTNITWHATVYIYRVGT